MKKLGKRNVKKFMDALAFICNKYGIAIAGVECKKCKSPFLLAIPDNNSVIGFDADTVDIGDELIVDRIVPIIKEK